MSLRNETSPTGSVLPPVPLVIILNAALPQLSSSGRAVIQALVSSGGGGGADASALAARLGLRSRFALARLLQREGLPSLGQLTRWTCVLQWLWDGEATGDSLQQLVRSTAMSLPTCYRLLKRTTGHTWGVVRSRGFAWALLRFLTCCQLRRTQAQPAGRNPTSPCRHSP